MSNERRLWYEDDRGRMVLASVHYIHVGVSRDETFDTLHWNPARDDKRSEENYLAEVKRRIENAFPGANVVVSLDGSPYPTVLVRSNLDELHYTKLSPKQRRAMFDIQKMVTSEVNATSKLVWFGFDFWAFREYPFADEAKADD